jgi:DNA repair protein RadA
MPQSTNKMISFHQGCTSLFYLPKIVGNYGLDIEIIALHRAEFTGRGTLAERQQRLNIMLHKLSRLADVHNIAVVVTNQVQSQPDDFSAGRDGLRATGGNVMGHGTTYRILLRKAGKVRIAIMVDSPYHMYDQTRFSITEADSSEKIHLKIQSYPTTY